MGLLIYEQPTPDMVQHMSLVDLVVPRVVLVRNVFFHKSMAAHRDLAGLRCNFQDSEEREQLFSKLNHLRRRQKLDQVDLTYLTNFLCNHLKLIHGADDSSIAAFRNSRRGENSKVYRERRREKLTDEEAARERLAYNERKRAKAAHRQAAENQGQDILTEFDQLRRKKNIPLHVDPLKFEGATRALIHEYPPIGNAATIALRNFMCDVRKDDGQPLYSKADCDAAIIARKDFNDANRATMKTFRKLLQEPMIFSASSASSNVASFEESGSLHHQLYVSLDQFTSPGSQYAPAIYTAPSFSTPKCAKTVHTHQQFPWNLEPLAALSHNHRLSHIGQERESNHDIAFFHDDDTSLSQPLLPMMSQKPMWPHLGEQEQSHSGHVRDCPDLRSYYSVPPSFHPSQWTELPDYHAPVDHHDYHTPFTSSLQGWSQTPLQSLESHVHEVYDPHSAASSSASSQLVGMMQKPISTLPVENYEPRYYNLYGSNAHENDYAGL